MFVFLWLVVEMSVVVVVVDFYWNIFCDIFFFSVLVQSVFNALLTDSARTKHFLKPSLWFLIPIHKVAIPPVLIGNIYKCLYRYIYIFSQQKKNRNQNKSEKSGVDNYININIFGGKTSRVLFKCCFWKVVSKKWNIIVLFSGILKG